MYLIVNSAMVVKLLARRLVRRYNVEFTSLAVNCESCHGPGITHIKSMTAIVTNIVNESQSVGINSLIGMSPNKSLNVCFQCHAVKTPIKTGYLPGEKLEEFYSLKLALLGNENPYAS